LSGLTISPEVLARALLKFAGMQAPVDLYELSAAIGLKIKDVPSSTFDGALVRVAGRPRGIIAKRRMIEDEGRRQFTIAHEIGHYILPGHGVDISACTKDDLDVAKAKVAQAEKEANRFASELLMPSALVAPIVDKYGLTIKTCNFICRLFRASYTAAASKCVQASDREVAMIITDSGVLRYFQRGRRWKYRIKQGEALSEESMATLLRSNRMGEINGEVPATAWTSAGTGLRLWEESVMMPRYKRVVTLLSTRLPT